MSGCCCEEKGIIVYQSFDTRFLGVDWLSISFESRFQLEGFKAKFSICGYSFEWDNLLEPKIINLTAEQTATIPIGLNYAELIVWDNEDNAKPFSTSIPVICKNWVESETEVDTFNMSVNAVLEDETQMLIRIETANVTLDWVEEKIAEHNADEEAHPYILGELDKKVDKVSEANRVYGTNGQGEQTTYDVESFGKVDDVRVHGVSVVENKIANLGKMAGVNYAVLIRRL